MPTITPDTSEVVEVVPGTYNVRLTDAAIKESRKGVPMVRWEMTIFAAEDTRLNNQRIWNTTMIAGPGAFGFKNLFLAVTGEEFQSGTPVNTDDFLGREVTVTVAKNDAGYMDVRSISALSVAA